MAAERPVRARVHRRAQEDADGPLGGHGPDPFNDPGLLDGVYGVDGMASIPNVGDLTNGPGRNARAGRAARMRGHDLAMCDLMNIRGRVRHGPE